MTEFAYTTTAQRVVFGAGALDRLAEAAGALGWTRLLLCTSPSLRRNGTVGRIAEGLGDALVAVYDGVEPHVQERQVEEARALAVARGADAVVGLGGGSPVGLAKAVSHALEAAGASPDDPPRVPCAAIPTTYAGSEMTPVFGVTRRSPDGTTRKASVRDARAVPRLVLYDPALTLDLPPALTASTGVNALAHGVEAVYSRTRNPLSTAAALRCIHHVARVLPRCLSDGDDLAARTEMLAGAHLGGVALATVEMGLHHGTGHVLGGAAGVPHGAASAVVLPHAVRFNADAVAPELALVAETLGLPRDGRSDEAMALAAADFFRDFIGRLGLPQRLRDVGVERAALPRLADDLLASAAVRANPKPLTDPARALAYLDAMW